MDESYEITKMFVCNDGSNAIALCIFTACVPSKGPIYTEGDTYNLMQDDGAVKASIKLESADYLLNDDDKTCNLSLTYHICPSIFLELKKENVYAVYDGSRTYTDDKLNVEKNGSDIFASKIEEGMKYTFYFIIPVSPYFENLENREKGYLGWAYLVV